MLPDPQKVKDIIVQYIRDCFDANSPGCNAVVGILGDINSSVVAAMCVEALGKSRVTGVLMPNGIQDGCKDSLRLVKELGIEHFTIDISGAVKELMLELRGHMRVSERAREDFTNRIRTATLYAVARSLPRGGYVVGTDNFIGGKTEAITPLPCLTDDDVRQLRSEIPALAGLYGKDCRYGGTVENGQKVAM